MTTIDANLPSDLHDLQYARGLLEKVLGWPAAKSNLELLADCLHALRTSRRFTAPQAYRYLERAIRLARDQGTPVDRFFFLEGKYTEVRPEKPERFPLFDRDARELEALAREQSTPEWQAANAQLRATLARLAGKTVMSS